jgi:hypothetical protein
MPDQAFHRRIPDPSQRERTAAILAWEPAVPAVPDQPPDFRGMHPRDLTLLQQLVEMRYSLIRHAAICPAFTNYSYAARRLRQFEAHGWIQRARFPMLHTETTRAGLTATRRRAQTVYSITAAGLAWLRQLDPEWAESHQEWEAPAGQPIAIDRVRHELDRNTAVQALVTAAPTPDGVHWTHGSAGVIRAYPFGLQGERLHIIPDAVCYWGSAIWLIELERSWRTSTIAKKSHQYGLYFQHQLWRQRFWQRPRVLFVLTDTSTQHVSLDTWWQHAPVLRGTSAYVTRLATLADLSTAPFYHQAPQAPHPVQQTTWAALHPAREGSGSSGGPAPHAEHPLSP